MKLMIVFVSCFLAFSQGAWAWSRVTNGAGGTVQDGQYLTFYSADVPVQGAPLNVQDVPGLSFLLNQIKSMPVNLEMKGQLLGLAYPVGVERSYYKVSDEDLDLNLRQEIIAEYSKLTRLPPGDLVIFALTNQDGQTLLLPEFYQLNQIQQAAVLLHEALWNFKMDLPYGDVVNTEIAAQKYFENPRDPAAYFNFFDALTRVMNHQGPHYEILLQAALSYDYAKIPAKNTMMLSQLLSTDFMKCYNGEDADLLQECSAILRTNILMKSSMTMFDRAVLAVLDDHSINHYFCITRDFNFENSDDDLLHWFQSAQIEKSMWHQTQPYMPVSRPDVFIDEFAKIVKNKTTGSNAAVGICFTTTH